jgi:hypothetical protein
MATTKQRRGPFTRVYNLDRLSSLVPGWQRDERFVYIGRPGHGLRGEWGNPFKSGDRFSNIRNYREWLDEQLETPLWRDHFLSLWGRGLVCFCAPLPCHGDVMAEKLDELVRGRRVLVTGGRDYEDAARVAEALEAAQPSTLIHGAARGADTLAARWALAHGVPTLAFPADWSRGRGAGKERNLQMLVEGGPELVLAFPGGRGTEDMVMRARQHGVPVVRVTRERLPEPSA